MAIECGGNIAARRIDPELLGPGIGDQRFDQPGGDPASPDLARHQCVIGDPHRPRRIIAAHPGKPTDLRRAGNMGVVFTACGIAVAGDRDRVLVHGMLLQT